MSYEEELEFVKHAIGSCKHFTWFDNAPAAGVCSPVDDLKLGCYMICPEIREDVEHCMECGGFYEA